MMSLRDLYLVVVRRDTRLESRSENSASEGRARRKKRILDLSGRDGDGWIDGSGDVGELRNAGVGIIQDSRETRHTETETLAITSVVLELLVVVSSVQDVTSNEPSDLDAALRESSLPKNGSGDVLVGKSANGVSVDIRDNVSRLDLLKKRRDGKTDGERGSGISTGDVVVSVGNSRSIVGVCTGKTKDEVSSDVVAVEVADELTIVVKLDAGLTSNRGA